MLLFVLSGLIAKLALVSSDCDIGTVKVRSFDWSKIADSRPWYWLQYDDEVAEGSLDCIVTTYADPVGNSSAITTNASDTSLQLLLVFTGNATSSNNTGLIEVHYTSQPFAYGTSGTSATAWNGRYNILAVDYDRYFIAKYCPEKLNKLLTAVAFRSQNPDEATWKDVESDLIHNGIDTTHLPKHTRDHCQQA